MKTLMRLKPDEVVNCVEEHTGRRIPARVISAGESYASLRCLDGTATFIDLTEHSDVTRDGHTLIFHG